MRIRSYQKDMKFRPTRKMFPVVQARLEALDRCHRIIRDAGLGTALRYLELKHAHYPNVHFYDHSGKLVAYWDLGDGKGYTIGHGCREHFHTENANVAVMHAVGSARRLAERLKEKAKRGKFSPSQDPRGQGKPLTV